MDCISDVTCFLVLIFGSFVAIALGRAFTVYPVAFLLNLFRSSPIPYDYQHIMWFTGIRGAIAFRSVATNSIFFCFLFVEKHSFAWWANQ